MDTSEQLILDILNQKKRSAFDSDSLALTDSRSESFLSVCAHHGIMPLVYHKLQDTGSLDLFSDSTRKQLRSAYMTCAARNVRIYRILAEILEKCRTGNIPVIVLKGAHLAECVYRNIALRPMVDLDLLIRPADLDPVGSLLSQLGFQSNKHYTHHRKPTRPVTYLHAEHGGICELHLTIESADSGFRIDLDAIWSRAARETIAGAETLVLSPEDLLVHLSLHFAYHHRLHSGLKSLSDISESIRHYGTDIDWNQLHRRATEWNIGKPVFLTLHLARDLIGAEVPEGILRDLQPIDFNPSIASDARDQVFDRGWTGQPVSDGLMDLCRRMRFPRKIARGFRRVFPDRGTLADLYRVPGDTARIYPFYLVRLKDLAIRYGPFIWRLIRRDPEVRERFDREKKLREWMDAA
ncbi:nucleotidyltransferase family protein [bacterium]|nr:nucleotidyltransferase family protein [candidate division CSSED10-310 bacterium]